MEDHPKTTKTDYRFLKIAISLGYRNLGSTWPNPSVGCIVVSNISNKSKSEIVGRGWTQPGGRPHAETVALRQAGDKAHNSTIFVTLEPCCHTGETPPCIKEIIR